MLDTKEPAVGEKARESLVVVWVFPESVSPSLSSPTHLVGLLAAAFPVQ